jgi:hypothetical protein
MISVDELYSFVQFIGNKSQASGNITPSQFNLILNVLILVGLLINTTIQKVVYQDLMFLVETGIN